MWSASYRRTCTTPYNVWILCAQIFFCLKPYVPKSNLCIDNEQFKKESNSIATFRDTMAGRSGYPNISGRVFRAFKISGFENWNPKFAGKNQNPTFRVTFRVPEISGSGSGKP